MALEKWKGKRALVTGASAGIGEACARELAKAGVHLVLTARRESRLLQLASELLEVYGVEIDWVASDLASVGGPDAIYKFTQGRKLQIDILVNNAGFGAIGQFVDNSFETAQSMVRVNITALVELSHLYLPDMLERKMGHIILVGSVNAFMPVPHFAVYSATKAFVRSFGEALALECKGRGVVVSAFHPGGTSTEFLDVAEMNLKPYMKTTLMSSTAVAKKGLEAAHRGTISTVTGLSNKLAVFFLWLLPDFLVRWGARALFSRLH